MDHSLDLVRSASLPIMSPTISHLVSMIDESESMNTIYDALCESDMVKNIADPNKWIGSDGMRVLFHSLSRQMLRSLLMKTLGPDLYSRDHQKANWERVFDPEGPGCYVCFLYVAHRSGKFLSLNETRELISQLEAYRRAVDIYQKYNLDDDEYVSSQEISEEEKGDYLTVMQIDDALRSTENWDLEDPDFNRFVPRFRSQTNEKLVRSGRNVKLSDNISALIRVLRKRCDPDFGPDVFQLQSPLLVGNSGDVASRAASHMLPSNFTNSPHLWGLLISCLSFIDIDIRTKYVTLFRTWTDDIQVNQAETLGTILAGSMIQDDGLNVKEPGTRRVAGSWTPNAYGDARLHVFVGKPWFRENLKQTMAYRPLGQLDAAKNELEKLYKEIDDNWSALVSTQRDLAMDRGSLRNAMLESREKRGRTEVKLTEAEELIKEMEKTL